MILFYQQVSMVHRVMAQVLCLFILAAIPLCAVSVSGSAEHLEALGLDAGEIAWLKEHQVIRVGVDPDFPPIEYFDKDGNHQGIAAEFLTFIEEKLQVQFDVIHLESWSEVIAQAKTRDLDMLAAAVPTPERLEYMHFTKPYAEFSAVVLVKNSMDDFPSLSELKGKRVAVVENYADHEHMVRAYPQVALEVMPDISSGLRQVSFGKVDAMVLNIASASYYIQKEGITNLMVTEDTDFVFDLSFAVRNDWPLAAILDKTMASMSEKERKEILDRWIALKQSGWRPTPLTILSSLAAVLVIVLFGILHWNRILQQRVRERTADLEVELGERLHAEQEKADLQRQVHKARKMEALGLLAGGVAHDLNNILSGVVGCSDLLLYQLPENADQRRLAAQIKDSGKRAAAVVADLLTISRNAAAERKTLNLNKLVDSYLESPEHQALVQRFPEVVFQKVLDQHSLTINGSETHINKCIMNLVVNAAEATEQGVVTISTEQSDIVHPENQYGGAVQPGKYVMLSVQDTGSGIAPEDVDRIFEPFYTRKEMGRSGTGLGLTVVWNTVKEHGGLVKVRQPEQGCQIQLYFPAVAHKEEAPLQSVEIAELQGHGESILVVDDDRQVRYLARELLQCLGYKVFLSSSGEEAIAFIKENKVDLLVLDMIMDPGLNGLKTYEQILELAPGQKALIASGFSESQDVKRTLQLGASAYIKKPYTLRELGLGVKNILGKV